MQRNIIKSSSYCDVHSLPRAANAANTFVFALAVSRAALGDRYRSFECVDYVRGANLAWIPCELIATVRAAR